MKAFQPYRNIRQKALIFGLPVNLFALFILVFTGSLIVVIFSFGLLSILVGGVLNLSLFNLLNHFARHPDVFNFKKVFPGQLSNKCSNMLHYEEE